MQPDQSAPEIEPGHGHFLAYYRIARHYKWAFNHLFNSMEYKQLVVIEDDMEVSPDFFHYFEAFLPVLRSDPTLMCVSAWNDNGKGDVASDPSAFYRSDFFPGSIIENFSILKEIICRSGMDVVC
jgi:alpha-1,3-mannosyl-glycoprotein beta-1,2-N-acetylglucosaminyltransferase